MSQLIGCVILVIQNNQILLGMRRNSYAAGTYGAPGGRVEVGERLVECVQRELTEETGLVAKNVKYVGVIKENQGNKDFVHFIFKCDQWEGEPRCREPEKCEGWKWYDLNDLPTPILPGHRWGIDLLINSRLENLRDC